MNLSRTTLIIALISTASSAIAQTTFYVNDSCGNDAWTGTSSVCSAPDGPKLTIQAGIDAAKPGDLVLIADGIYTGAQNKNLDFAGKAITVRSVSGPDGCVIDCQGDGRGFYFHSNETHDSIVQGLTITNGDVESAGYFGGAIRMSGSSPTISNCVLIGNRAPSGGGGIACDSGASPVITQCVIRRNFGGGIFCNGANNDATIVDCTITRNATDGRGGGIACSGNNTTITNCVISENTAERGGGVDLNGGQATITSSTIIANVAGDHGGGVWLSAGTVVNCIIAGNSAFDGGGIYASLSMNPLTNCTITGNTATKRGGAVFFGSTDAFFVTNCVLWNNSAALGPEIATRSRNVTLANSDMQGGRAAQTYGEVIWADGNIDADPVFAFADDFHLMPASPCIDAGTNDPPGGLPPRDLDGNARPLDGDGNGVAVADMGVFEFNPASPSIAVSAASFEFFAPEGGPNPVQQVLSLRNSGPGTLTWEIAAECAWLQADPQAGTSTGEIVDVALNLDVSALLHGDYTCFLTVSDPKAANSPRVIPVMLHVNATLQVPTEYGTIQAAIVAAVDGDVVLVSDGRYTGPGNKDLKLHGKAITVRSVNGPDNCIIDCEGAGRGFDFHSGDTHLSILDGLTITNGFAGAGGGINCLGLASPTIMNCTITSNRAGTEPSGSGGGVYCGSFSQPRLINCTITNNTSGRHGGGISASESRTMPIITDCLISGNTAADGTGGGVFIATGCSAIISGCRILSNVAGDRGGGIGTFQFTDPVITDCVIADNSGSNVDGAGIYVSLNCDATIRDCIISGNSGGVAVHLLGGTSTMTDCTIAQNMGAGVGIGGETTIIRCRIEGNRGSGLGVSGSAIAIDCTIVDNVTAGSGGGVAFTGHGSPTIIRCDIARNSARWGGGVSCFFDLGLELINCTIAGNSANFGGGLYCSRGGSATLTGCTISGNQAAEAGGGVYVADNGEPELTNCSITDNSTQFGGGLICRDDSSPRLTGCTISRNLATQAGGGLWVEDNAVPEFTNCILWRDMPQEIFVLSGAPAPVLRYCDVQGGWPGVGNVNADPLFVDPVGGDYHLASGSPCIDTGDPDFIPQPGETDMDRQVRVWNERVDIGADEFGSFVIGDINCDGVINALDIEPFLLALFDPPGYAANYPDCDINLADLNGDGNIDASDIEPFLGALFDQ